MSSAEAPPASRDAAARRAYPGVVGAFFVHGLLFASWTAHIPLIKAALHIGNGTLGLALLGAPVGSVTAIWITAYLVPRLGSRRVVQVSVLGYAASGALVGLVGSVPQLFLALLLWGAFMGMLDISMNAQGIAVEHARGRPLLNGMHACWSLGAFAGAGAGALGVAIGLGLTPQLLILGIPTALVTVVLCVRMLADSAADNAAQDGAGKADADAPPPAKTRTLSVTVLLLGAVAFASMLCEGAAADWSSVYLRESAAGSAAIAGLGYTVFALAMVFVRMSGDRLLARFGAWRVIPLLAVVAAVALTVALIVGAVATGLVAFFLLGLGVGAVVPTTFSAAGRIRGLHPGRSIAAVSGLGWAGFVLGPPVIGQLAAVTSLPLALGLVPLLCAFIAATTLRVTAMHN
jgi:MFS family permease